MLIQFCKLRGQVYTHESAEHGQAVVDMCFVGNSVELSVTLGFCGENID